jgi:hypothetical protein
VLWLLQTTTSLQTQGEQYFDLFSKEDLRKMFRTLREPLDKVQFDQVHMQCPLQEDLYNDMMP